MGISLEQWRRSIGGGGRISYLGGTSNSFLPYLLLILLLSSGLIWFFGWTDIIINWLDIIAGCFGLDSLDAYYYFSFFITFVIGYWSAPPWLIKRLIVEYRILSCFLLLFTCIVSVSANNLESEVVSVVDVGLLGVSVRALSNSPKRKRTRRGGYSGRMGSAEFERMYDKLLTEANKIPSDGEVNGHKRLFDILNEDGMKGLIAFIFKILPMSPAERKSEGYDNLAFVVELFQVVGVNIFDFRDDIEEKFDEKGLGSFLKMMLCYTLRFKQGGCACGCGRQINKLFRKFGALGFESNHYADDKASNGMLGTKRFNLSRNNFDRDLEDLLFEFVKTRLECWECHNR